MTAWATTSRIAKAAAHAITRPGVTSTSAYGAALNGVKHCPSCQRIKSSICFPTMNTPSRPLSPFPSLDIAATRFVQAGNALTEELEKWMAANGLPASEGYRLYLPERMRGFLPWWPPFVYFSKYTGDTNAYIMRDPLDKL